MLGAQASACNNSPLIEVPACRPGGCTCEEDPTQAECRAFNEPTEGGKDPGDANPVEAAADSATIPEGDASDAAADAATD